MHTQTGSSRYGEIYARVKSIPRCNKKSSCGASAYGHCPRMHRDSRIISSCVRVLTHFLCAHPWAKALHSLALIPPIFLACTSGEIVCTGIARLVAVVCTCCTVTGTKNARSRVSVSKVADLFFFVLSFRKEIILYERFCERAIVCHYLS